MTQTQIAELLTASALEEIASALHTSETNKEIGIADVVDDATKSLAIIADDEEAS